jgi:hypothetical protein
MNTAVSSSSSFFASSSNCVKEDLPNIQEFTEAASLSAATGSEEATMVGIVSGSECSGQYSGIRRHKACSAHDTHCVMGALTLKDTVRRDVCLH